MKITKDIVRKTAHLARLELDEDKEKQAINDLQQMVDWMDTLNEVNTEGVEPLTNMSFEIDALRDDVAKVHLDKRNVFQNAPKHNNEHFMVPKVIDK